MRRAVLAALSCAAFLASAPAYAHGTIAGMGSFYSGLLHPFLVPSHVLALAAAGLLIGQSGRGRLMLPLLTFLLVYAGALAATFWGAATGETAVLLVAAVAGIVVAAGVPAVSRAVAIPVAAGAGAALGLDSGADAASVQSALSIVAGTYIGGAYAILNLAIFTSNPSRLWQRIGVRVVGSWAVAASFLVLALELSRFRT